MTDATQTTTAETTVAAVMDGIEVCTDGGRNGAGVLESWQEHEDRLGVHSAWNCPETKAAVTSLVAERDKYKVLAEMNANLSKGHCRELHAAQADADALADALAEWMVAKVWADGTLRDLANKHQKVLDQHRIAAHDARRGAEAEATNGAI